MSATDKPLKDVSQVAIIGTGLLGGSIGLGLRAAGYSGRLITVGRPEFSDSAVERALKQREQSPQVQLVSAGALVELLLAIKVRALAPEHACTLFDRFVHLDVARIRAQLRVLVKGSKLNLD